MAPATGTRDGDRYELLGELATGGMATVYLGRMRRPMGFARLVAIKCMHPQYAKDPSFASMFVDEARLTARLRHPNIVPTLDIVADGGHLLIVMEYVEGESLAGLLKLVRDANEHIPVEVACAIIHDLLLGLHEAHEAHDDDGQPLAIIHRDVSPQNVLIGFDGLARVLDFGVAKARSRVHHSNEGEIKGKIPYMPPEQLFGEGVDRRVDVYGAGVLFWEALTGKRLFDGASEEVLVRHIDAGALTPPSAFAPGVSPELDAIVMRALCKEASGRYDTALEMAEAISKLVPLPPRTEISAWIKRFAKTRPVPATSMGSSSDLATDERGHADEIVKALERKTVITRSSLAPVSASQPPVSLDVAEPQAKPKATSRAAMFLGIAAFAIAGVVAGRAMRAENAFAAPTHHAAAAQLPVATAAPVTLTNAAPAATTESAATESAATEAPKAAEARVAVAEPRAKKIVAHKAAPSNAKAATAEPASPKDPAPTAAPQTTTTDSKPASCRPPYVVDAEGHRHYKVECL
ncbi:MAG: serine/threonine protein kinase [Deltaproteobacteria bacterium]|nr:serine/threonine protein kinase [Deltaproteobacteria bacterium]